MIKTTHKLEGFAELEKALSEIEKTATKKALGRRVLKNAGEPLADDMNRGAPDGVGEADKLNESYSVSTKLNPSQKKKQRRVGKSDVEVYVGTNHPAGVQQEFGNVNHPPQPHARPAWDANQNSVLNDIKTGLGNEIHKTAQRQAKKVKK